MSCYTLMTNLVKLPELVTLICDVLFVGLGKCDVSGIFGGKSVGDVCVFVWKNVSLR